MPRRATACLSLVAVALLATPAAAQDSRTWIFDDNPELPTLIFGVPETDDTLFTMACDPRQKTMSIVESVMAKKLNPGGTASFKLSTGSTTLELTGDAISSETDGGVSIEVTGPPNPRLFALLKGGPSLTIEVAGAKETIPLAAAAPHLAAFEKLCLGRR